MSCQEEAILVWLFVMLGFNFKAVRALSTRMDSYRVLPWAM